jgi:hypothetical protein
MSTGTCLAIARVYHMRGKDLDPESAKFDANAEQIICAGR